MTRVSISFAILLFAVSIHSPNVQASPPANEQPFSTAYLDAVNAELELMTVVLEKEERRLEAMQRLFQHGHASWLEVRQQQLAFDQQAVTCEAYWRFGAFVKEQTELESPRQWVNPNIGKLPFTDLLLMSKAKGLVHIDINELLESHQLLINDQKSISEKIEKETNALAANDSWKAAYEIRLRVAKSELKAAQARYRLLENFQASHDGESTGSSDTEKSYPATLASQDLINSLRHQCDAHIRLVDYCLEQETTRLEKLNELDALGIASKRDMEIVSGRRSQLLGLKNLQESVATYVQQIGDESSDAQDETTKSELTNDSSNSWDRIQNQFCQLESTAQQHIAKLEKEMLVEVLQRLEKAAARNVATNQNANQFSTTLAAGQQAELQNYRRKIKLADLQMELATARLHTLRQHEMSGTYFVAIKPNAKRDGNAPSLHAALVQPNAMLGLLLTASGESSTSISSASVRAFLPHAGFGSYSSCPTQFRNLYSNYRSVPLADFSRPLQLSSRSSGSIARSKSILSLKKSRGLSSSLSPRRHYSSTYSRNRSLQTFDRVYQNGILRSEYRQFLTPGQPPWLFPGSSSNLRVNQLRTNRRSSSGRSGYELLRSRTFTDLYRN